MKACSECSLPLSCTAKTVHSVWEFMLNHEYNNSNIKTLKTTSIQFELQESTFKLKLSKKPLKAIEEWNTPFGLHENIASNNRGVLDLINKWFQVLSGEKEANIITFMSERKLIQTNIRAGDLCTSCKPKTKAKKAKKVPAKRKTKKKVPTKRGETKIAIDKKKAAILEDSTLIQLRAVAIEERIAKAKKQKMAWKDIIIMYLEEKVQSTKDRHVDEIAKALDVETTQILDIIQQLIQEEKVQKEFPLFEDYIILTQNYKSELTRKYLEIQNYFKTRANDPYCCTQASVSLEYELPFSIVGVLLNDMTTNKLIRKKTTKRGETKKGKPRKVRYYSSTSY